MKDELISKVMDEVMKKMGASDATSAPAAACCSNASANCNLTEFVGTAIGHTIGLVIANVDHQIHEKMDIDPKYRSIGIIGDRTGAGPQIFAADEAVKATNCEIVKIELPRDTEGGAGHGSLIIFGAEDVSDARRAVEVCLREVERTMGDVYGSPAGHLEFQYTARASHALNIQGHIKRRLFVSARFFNIGSIGVRPYIGMRSEFIQSYRILALPFGQRLFLRRSEGSSQSCQ